MITMTKDRTYIYINVCKDDGNGEIVRSFRATQGNFLGTFKARLDANEYAREHGYKNCMKISKKTAIAA